jgi:DNA repair exonuclease SbcCD ATPase subunit
MIPFNIKIKNFYSHRDSEVDFSQFNSVLLIGNTEGDYGKSNGSGKSAILESILWCLFNKSRAPMMNDIIRWGEASCSVELEFDHDGTRYKILRTRNRKNSTSSVEFSYLNKLGDWSDLSGSTSGSTNDIIEKAIKLDYKTFVNSIYFRQNDISEFAEADPAKKKDILKSIIDISRWDDYEKISKKMGRDISSECKILEASISKYDETESSLMDSEASLRDKVDSLGKLKSERAVISEKLDRISKEYDKIKKSLDTDNYDNTVEEIEALRVDVEKISSRLNNVDIKISDEKSIIESLNKDLALKIESISNIEISDNIDDKIKRIQDGITEASSASASSRSMLESLRDVHVIHGECYVCGQDIDNTLYGKLKDGHNKKIDMHKAEFDQSEFNLKKLKKDLSNAKILKSNTDKVVSTESEIESVRIKIDARSDVLESHNTARESISRKFFSKKTKLAASEEMLESLKDPDFKNLQKKIHSLKTERDRVSACVIADAKDIGSLTERVSTLKGSMADMENKKKELNKKKKRVVIFEKLTRMLGKSGIQTILLDGIIDDLESTANRILGSIANEPILISLETQRIGSDGVSIVETLDLKIRKDGNLQDFKSLSGGEKFRISLALRVALSDLSSRYGGASLEFLLLDEVNSPLDRYGVETLFVNVIKSLESSYKIMVITHDETLKEKFDSVIDVTKVNGESEIEFISR